MIITIWRYQDRHGGLGGVSPSGVAEFVRNLELHGHAIVTDDRHHTPSNHRIAGIGVGHDDAKFAEVGESMGAYYENGDAFAGRWWENTDRFSPTIAYYDPSHPNFARKTGGHYVKEA